MTSASRPQVTADGANIVATVICSVRCAIPIFPEVISLIADTGFAPVIVKDQTEKCEGGYLRHFISDC